jgi:sulfoxide reductase heme-binding subunit YedZ
MKRARFTPLQIIAHIAAWGLVAWLVFDFLTGNLTINPIQAATQRTGRYAIAFLALSLACTPVNTLFGLRQAISVRRTLGLYAFMFAGMHFLIFSGVDYGFDLGLIGQAIVEKNYILVGLAALTILIVLAITSFRYWMKRLGKNWKRLHRLAYLAGGLVVIHYAWAVKGDLLRLKGDIWMPLFYVLAIGLLLLVRIPPIRSATAGLHHWMSGALRRSPARLKPKPGSDV